MVRGVRNKNVWGVSNAALSIGVVLAWTPLPDFFIINVSFAGRVFVAQESTGEDRDRVLVVGDAGELAVELGIDVVGEVLVSDLCGKGVKLLRMQA